MKVFLGGTVAGSKWRDYMMPKLEIEYFNPVVDVWTEDAQREEIFEREHCEFCLYVISPKLIGWYSLAEVIDDSYKKSDKTIYCFLPTDEDAKFTEEQIKELQELGKIAQSNGAIWKNSLNEVIDFLNSANVLANDVLLQQTDQINDAFISYGRRHSLAFARKLYHNLINRGFKVWFDMNDIPLGVDFQEQIDDGIRKADNFIYVISPHSINSIYCYKELVLALKYNKRIIPILHVEPQDGATWDKIPPEAGKRNWIYLRQNHDTALELSAKTFEVQEKILNTAEADWKFTDKFKPAFDSLVSLIDSHRAYVRTHTVLLDKSLYWKKNSRMVQELLVGKGRTEAERFLQRSHLIFKNHTGHIIQPPCYPTDLIAEYIMESKKNSSLLQCDLFMCHDTTDNETVLKISSGLAKHGFSSWISSKDISKGEESMQATYDGLVRSVNVLFFISKKSLYSNNCKREYEYALQYNKRIIPILITNEISSFKELPNNNFSGLEQLQYINFTNLTNELKIDVKNHSDVHADVEARREKTPFESSIDELIHSLSYEFSYYEEHCLFLVQALKWKAQKQKTSFLLRGFNFEDAKIWLRLNSDRTQYAPLKIHNEFIKASDVAKGQLGTDVFISYSRKDGDIARYLNQELQKAGKTTWFDQESISKGVDFEKEMFKGINGADNFVFVISPDSISSEYCEKEVDYASSQNKRIITLLARETNPESMPKALRVINWIDLRESLPNAFSDLIQAIELDSDHAYTHTLMQQRASEWREHKYSYEFSLNSIACNNAEKWLKKSFKSDLKSIDINKDLETQKNPKPTDLQIAYIKTSRKRLKSLSELEEKKRKRLNFAVIVASIIAVAAIGLFIYARQQTKFALRMRTQVETVMFDKAVEKEIDNWTGIEGVNAKKYIEQIDSIDLSSCVLLRLPKEVVECKKLIYIDLMDNPNIDFKDCFEKLSKLPNLEEIKISVNNINEIPVEFRSKIKGLELITNEVFTNLNTLTNLTELILEGNRLTELPKVIFELENLKILNLEYNNLTVLPSEICKLKNLTVLNLRYNKLTKLPKEIGKLVELEKIDVYKNELDSLPKEIGRLTKLQFLYVEKNKLDSLPKEIGNLINLKGVKLNHNKITSVPDEIGNLSNLEYLNLSENELKKLPSSIAGLKKLKKLVIWKNKIKPVEKDNIQNKLPKNCETNF